MSSKQWLPNSNHSTQQTGYLVNIEPLKKVIECALISPYIKAEKPISLLIVAKAESGKTSAMKMYRENKGIIYLSDCTAYGITRDVLPKIVSGEIKTIMIPDLITPLAKQTKTRQGFVTFLNNLIEEGVAKMTSYSTMWNKDANANVITAVTDEELRDSRHNWAKIGFLSRFISFSYSYSISTVTQILDTYSVNAPPTEKAKLKLPRKQVNIDLSKEIADKLNPTAREIGEQFRLYGLRAKVNFRSLLKSLAVRNGNKSVTESEFEEFLELADYMNFRYNPIEELLMVRRIAVYGTYQAKVPFKQRVWKKRIDGIRQRYWKKTKRRKSVEAKGRYEFTGSGRELYQAVLKAQQVMPKGFVTVSAKKFLQNPKKYGYSGSWIERDVES